MKRLLLILGFALLAGTVLGQYHPDHYGLVTLSLSDYDAATGEICIPAQTLPFIIPGGTMIKNGVKLPSFNTADLPRMNAIEDDQGLTARNHSIYLLSRWPAIDEPVFPAAYLYPANQQVCLDLNTLTGYAIYGNDSPVEIHLNLLYWDL